MGTTYALRRVAGGLVLARLAAPAPSAGRALRTTRRPRGRAEPLLLAGLVDDDAEIEAFEAALQGALVGAQPDWARRIRVICAAVRAGFSHLSAAASASTSAGVRGVTLAG